MKQYLMPYQPDGNQFLWQLQTVFARSVAGKGKKKDEQHGQEKSWYVSQGHR
jgi:hypothetical protein